MNCDGIIEKLRIPRDELTEDERALVDAHLDQCDACRSAAREYDALDARVRSTLADQAARAPGWERLESEWLDAVRRPLRKRPFPRLLRALAASALACVGLWAAYETGRLRAENAALRQKLRENQTRLAAARRSLQLVRRRTEELQKRIASLERAGAGIVVYQLFPPARGAERRPRRAVLEPPLWGRPLSQVELRSWLENGGA